MRKMTLAMMVQLENSMKDIDVTVDKAPQGGLGKAEEAAKTRFSTRGKLGGGVEVKEVKRGDRGRMVKHSGGIGI